MEATPTTVKSIALWTASQGSATGLLLIITSFGCKYRGSPNWMQYETQISSNIGRPLLPEARHRAKGNRQRAHRRMPATWVAHGTGSVCQKVNTTANNATETAYPPHTFCRSAG